MTTAVNFTGLILLTGLPGSGKSLRMVTYMKQALELGRPVFVCNMPDIKLAGVQMLDDPHTWQSLPPEAILFVDEAQRFFRSRRGTAEVPPSIQAMETIRHDGVCIVMTTQQPTYLDKHIRGLIGRHEHLVRNFGHESANVYEFRECYDDVQSPTLRDNAVFSVWLFPKKNYAEYVSAEVHTVKARWPRKVIIGIVCALLALAFLGRGLYGLLHVGDPLPAPNAAQAASEPGTGGGGATGTTYRTADELIDYMRPRVATIPYSAPAFDGRGVVAVPRLFCMSSGVDSCSCITEQGTRYKLALRQCKDIARHGPAYDPFLEPAQPGIRGDAMDDDQRQDESDTARTVAGIGHDAGPIIGSPGQGAVWGKEPAVIRAAEAY